MAGTYDNVCDVLDIIESQQMNYVMLIIEPKPNKKEDKLTIFTSLSEGAINKLIEALKKVQQQEKKKKKPNGPKKTDF